MNTLKNWIIATATAAAVMAPLVGAAEARRGEFRGDQHNYERRGGYGDVAQVRRRRAMRTPLINRRINRQRNRIRRGRDRGNLTRIEAIRLRGRLISIRSARSFARLDGRVTRAERLRLMDMLDANSARIRRLSRNGRRSY